MPDTPAAHHERGDVDVFDSENLESFPSEGQGRLIASSPPAASPRVLDRILTFEDPRPADDVVVSEITRPGLNAARRHAVPRIGALRSHRLERLLLSISVVLVGVIAATGVFVASHFGQWNAASRPRAEASVASDAPVESAPPEATAPMPAARLPARSVDAPQPSKTRHDPRGEPSSDQVAIQTVLDRYRTAFSTLDVETAAAVWPTVDPETLSKSFNQLAGQQLEFRNCRITVNGVQGIAVCKGTAMSIPKDDAGSARPLARTWTFKLYKVDSGWVINTVDSR